MARRGKSPPASSLVKPFCEFSVCSLPTALALDADSPSSFPPAGSVGDAFVETPSSREELLERVPPLSPSKVVACSHASMEASEVKASEVSSERKRK